jgi:hypothetical protein
MIAVATMRKITPGYLYHNYLIDALKLHRETNHQASSASPPLGRAQNPLSTIQIPQPTHLAARPKPTSLIIT